MAIRWCSSSSGGTRASQCTAFAAPVALHLVEPAGRSGLATAAVVCAPGTDPGEADRPWSPTWAQSVPKSPWQRLVEIRESWERSTHIEVPPAAAAPAPGPGGLRIAYLVYRGNPRCGGQGVYTRHLARELVDLGHSGGGASPASRGPCSTTAWASPLCPASTCTGTPTPSGSRIPASSTPRSTFSSSRVMCTAGFPEPRDLLVRGPADSWPSARGDFDIVHDNQCLGSGLLGHDGRRLAAAHDAAPPHHRRPGAGAVARRERLPPPDPAALVRVPGDADQGGPAAAPHRHGVGVLQGRHRRTRWGWP